MVQPFEAATRFQGMSNAGSQHKSALEARQGVSGMGVRYVLAISLSAALAGMALLWFFLGTP
jgi:hypothetical protein